MESNSIYRGEDKVIVFTVKDDSGTVVDLATGFTGVIVHLVDSDENVLAKYSRETIADHNSDDFIQLDQTTDTGKFQVLVQSVDTLSSPLGKIYFEVKFQSANGAFDNGTFDQIVRIETADNGKAFELKSAKTKHITSLS